jgi:hypothetical protein
LPILANGGIGANALAPSSLWIPKCSDREPVA